MENTLGKKSSITIVKSKFFIYRILTYFSFLLIPVWIQKSVDLNMGFQTLIMVFYILFIVGQWFLLGKEIDHRLKIYYKVNSSMDRVAYRVLLGQMFMFLLFNCYSLIPSHLLKHFFWGTWVVLGLYYSWPTRGKIIQESVTSELGEFNYLDAFEKTVILISLLLFVFSVPEIPEIYQLEVLKEYFDPSSHLSRQFWNFLEINYFPFKKYSGLMRLAYCLHFYFVGLGLFILSFYALTRFFFSRRVSILGLLVVLSSWSLSKFLVHGFGLTITSSFSLFWVWSLFWVAKSSTYRAGLFLGLMVYYGTLIYPHGIFLSIGGLGIIYVLYFKEKNFWFLRQLLKYFSFGFALGVITYFIEVDRFLLSNTLTIDELVDHYLSIFERKAFYILSVFGVVGICLKYLYKKKESLRFIDVDLDKVTHLILCILFLLLFSFTLDSSVILFFSALWIVTVFSLFPIEQLFKATTGLRSKRNLIYVIYILACLLDSHFEGRVKIFARLFN